MLPKWYVEYKNLVNISIEKYLVDYFSEEKNIGLNKIKEATIYACKGGKRVRSILAILFYLIITKKDFKSLNGHSPIIKFCISVELLHSYSLVHDDLPSMDNDEYRRGELTVWKKYSDADAVLVGDLLNSLSFEILADIGDPVLIKYFGQSVGINGMVGGQVLDLFYEQNPDKLSFDDLIEVHNKKTGALIEMSVLGSLLIAEKESKYFFNNKINDVTEYLDFGKKIGLAFQVKDDLLDVEGTLEETGKSVGDGEEKGFVYFLGVIKTKEYLDALIADSLSIVDGFKSEKLIFLINYIGSRRK